MSFHDCKESSKDILGPVCHVTWLWALSCTPSMISISPVWSWDCQFEPLQRRIHSRRATDHRQVSTMPARRLVRCSTPGRGGMRNVPTHRNPTEHGSDRG